MASYHFAVQVLGRSPKVDRLTGRTRPGASAVAAAAYRARAMLHDERSGKTEDYRRKGGLERAEIMLPEGAAPWLGDRQKLWNHVEALEKREDAQLAREINMALPHELTDAQRVELVRGFVAEQFVSKGMVVDIAWHRPVESAGDDPRNFHAHIMLTLRQATPEGLRRVKTREWNSRELIGAWREAWRDHQNSFLREAGHAARVDHRSLDDQRYAALERGDRRAAARLDRMPEIHVGPKARRMQGRGTVPPSRVREVGPRRLKYGSSPHAFGYVSEARREERRTQRREEWRAARRVRDYPAFDYGTRLGWLTNILTGNDQKTKAKIVKTERQMARLSRKLDHWERQVTFHTEGVILGPRFRWLRAQKAAEERAARARARQKAEHAAKRARQAKELMTELQLVFVALRGGREAVLARQRVLADWTRKAARERDRGQSRGRRP